MSVKYILLIPAMLDQYISIILNKHMFRNAWSIISEKFSKELGLKY